MLVLGLENSGRLCSCALVQDENLLAETQVEHLEHSTLLPGLIDAALASAERKLEEVDLYAISIGPGSFTSLRVGLATFKAMALFGKKPLVSVSTLDAMAREVDSWNSLICPIIDAKRGEVYYALYRSGEAGLERLDGPDVIELRALVEKVGDFTVFLGSGVSVGREVFDSLGRKAVCLGISCPRASSICKLGRAKFEKEGGEHVSTLEPIYIKPSYAERRRMPRIERMRIEHLDQVTKVEVESFRYPWSRGAFEWEIKSEIALPIVARIDEEVIGYLVIWVAYDEMHLGNIAVAKKWRRKGMGKELMKWLFQEAKRRGIVRLTLEVRTSNLAAVSLYRKFGFRKVAVKKCYYPEGTDAFLMALELK